MDKAVGGCNGPALNYLLDMTHTLRAEILSIDAPEMPDTLPCTNDRLRRATRQLGLLYDDAFAPTGLKATQLGLMLQIACPSKGEAPTMQVVASRLGVGLSTLTYALRPLVRDALVDLHPDARDKRFKRVLLTDLGLRRLHEGGQLWAEANRRVESLLGPEDALVLRTLAERIASEEFAKAFRVGIGGSASEKPGTKP